MRLVTRKETVSYFRFQNNIEYLHSQRIGFIIRFMFIFVVNSFIVNYSHEQLAYKYTCVYSNPALGVNMMISPWR